MDWSQDNELMLMTYTLRSSSTSSSALNLAPVEDEIVSISAIPTMTLTVSPLYYKFVKTPCIISSNSPHRFNFSTLIFLWVFVVGINLRLYGSLICVISDLIAY